MVKFGLSHTSVIIASCLISLISVEFCAASCSNCVPSFISHNYNHYLDVQYSPQKWLVQPLSFNKNNQAASERTRQSVPYELNIRYGPGDKQLVDIYGTDLPPENDIVVFIHGGYWVLLDKMNSSNVVPPLYHNGFKVIVANYDQAPLVTVGHIIEETKELHRFVLDMADKWGSKKIWYIGHSVGAHLATSLLDHEFQQTLPEKHRSMVKGMVLLTGLYELSPLVFTHANDPLKMTCEEAAEWSPIKYLKSKHDVKLYFTGGKMESPLFQKQTMDAYKASMEAGNHAILKMLENVDHFTINERLEDPNFELTQEILHFIKE